MISVSHWGMFEITGRERTIPQLFADAIFAGFISVEWPSYDARYLHDH